MLKRWKSDIPRIAAALAASLIAVDGVIEEEEKAVAIALGKDRISGFSREVFEEMLAEIDSLPSAYELAAPLRKELDDETKDLILEYLVAVAGADHQMVKGEKRELQAVAKALGAPLPPLRVRQ